MNYIEIWQPRYKDRKVLLACHKVAAHNKVVFTKAKHLEGQEYYIAGSVANTYPKETNGKIMCFAVPLEELRLIEEGEF